MHFLLQVDMTAAVSKALDRYEADFRSVLRENKVRYINVKHDGVIINATFKDEESYQRGLDALKENFRLDLDFTKIKAERGITLVAAFKLAAQQELQNFALQQNITTLRKPLPLKAVVIHLWATSSTLSEMEHLYCLKVALC